MPLGLLEGVPRVRLGSLTLAWQCAERPGEMLKEQCSLRCPIVGRRSKGYLASPHSPGCVLEQSGEMLYEQCSHRHPLSQ